MDGRRDGGRDGGRGVEGGRGVKEGDRERGRERVEEKWHIKIPPYWPLVKKLPKISILLLGDIILCKTL